MQPSHRNMPIYTVTSLSLRFREVFRPGFLRSCSPNDFCLRKNFPPGVCQKPDSLITAHSYGRTHGPAALYLLLFMSVCACSSRSRSSPVFLRGVFSAGRANHAQSGRYPSGQAIQFSRCTHEHWLGLICSLHLWDSAGSECFLV